MSIEAPHFGGSILSPNPTTGLRLVKYCKLTPPPQSNGLANNTICSAHRMQICHSCVSKLLGRFLFFIGSCISGQSDVEYIRSISLQLSPHQIGLFRPESATLTNNKMGLQTTICNTHRMQSNFGCTRSSSVNPSSLEKCVGQNEVSVS